MIASYKLSGSKFVDRLLWKLGAKRRKSILKFFRCWSFEDELFDILAEEIRNEINRELLTKLGTRNERTDE